MIKEFTQLNEGVVTGKSVLVPTDAKTLTDVEKEKALPAVILIKEKCNGVIKVDNVWMVVNKKIYLS